jgi:ABC-2 type transport system permease protein
MVVFFGLPVFLAYGLVFKAGTVYYLHLVAVVVPFLVLSGAVGVIFTLILVNIFPAQRTKDILLLMAIALAIILYLLFRMMRPEQLVNPDAFTSIVSYFASMRSPSSPYFPSYWVSEVLWPHLVSRSYSDSFFYLALLTTTAAFCAVTASWTANLLYGHGFSKSQEAARKIFSRTGPLDVLIYFTSLPFSPASRAIIAKDTKTFFRDNSQWSQILPGRILLLDYPLLSFEPEKISLDQVLDLSPTPLDYRRGINRLLQLSPGRYAIYDDHIHYNHPFHRLWYRISGYRAGGRLSTVRD